jgi:hypothetical protein
MVIEMCNRKVIQKCNKKVLESVIQMVIENDRSDRKMLYMW